MAAHAHDESIRVGLRDSPASHDPHTRRSVTRVTLLGMDPSACTSKQLSSRGTAFEVSTKLNRS
ncbi:hypothetical protein ABIC51_008199 [Burkholderia sp. 572]